MNEPVLRPGIKEAFEVFWKHVDAIVPPIVNDRRHINDALFLALAQLNVIRDEIESDHALLKHGN